jgi:phage terminase large subunit-like protein
MAWWEPKDPDADHRLEKTWREANPGYGDLIDPEDFESAVRRTPEAEFRTKRCNQWVTSMRTWLPHGAWDACASARRLQDGEECILGFDGSYAGDSTALVACTFDGHLEIVGVWEKPADDEDWRVDIEDVEKAITAACRRYQVREVACDPYRWARSMQVLAADGIPIIEWPTNSAQRMVPATTRFGEAVLGKRLTHTGDTDLGRHIGNCVLKIDRIGPRIVKEHKMSARKIDLAVAAVIAYDRAMVQEEEPVPTIW